MALTQGNPGHLCRAAMIGRIWPMNDIAMVGPGSLDQMIGLAARDAGPTETKSEVWERGFKANHPGPIWVR